MNLRHFGTYNLMNFDSTKDGERGRQLARVIDGMGVDVLAVQELTAATQEQAERQLAALAAMTGMTATLPGQDGAARYAAGAGGNRFAVGLLWRDDPAIVALPETQRVYAGGNFFHSLIRMSFLIDGKKVSFVSWHGRPIGRRGRADEAERVRSAVAGYGPAFVGCDANTIGYARVIDPETQKPKFYDDDPYEHQPWQPGFIHTCTWQEDELGKIRAHRADREAARVLQAGGLHDVAAMLGTPWTATSGHHPADALGIPRRLAFIFADAEMAPLVQSLEIVETADALDTSDHLPVTTSWIS